MRLLLQIIIKDSSRALLATEERRDTLLSWLLALSWHLGISGVSGRWDRHLYPGCLRNIGESISNILPYKFFLSVSCTEVKSKRLNKNIFRRDGDVGSWSSFALRVGNPAQTVRVIPSTAGQSTWVIAPSGCPPDEPGISASLPCPQSRGELFDPAQSTSWHALSNNSLGLDANLGYGDLSALYGLDTIELGFSESIGGPKLDSQILSALAPEHYYVGLFGLNHQATNLSDFSTPHPSALTTLKENKLIPSLSWGFTAGAQYRKPNSFHDYEFYLAHYIVG